MKNKEKYEERVLTFACDESVFGVCEETGEMERCSKMHCNACLFYRKKETCHTNRRKWLEQEYIEKPVISKRDRAFLDCIKDKWKYMARDDISSAAYVFSEIPKKSKGGYLTYTGEIRRISTDFNVDFPMVKWSDSEPWLIEDLKKLEVVEYYE